MNKRNHPTTSANAFHIRHWLAAGVIGLTLAVPTQADDSAGSYAYQLHHAKPSVDQLGQEVSQYEQIGGPRYVIQGPDMTLEWLNRIAPDERTPANAIYPLYRETMGLLARHYWADGRPASQEEGWHGPGYAIYYDAFDTKFTRGTNDRDIAGQTAEHYVFNAQYVSWAEGDPRKEHNDVTYNLWVLPDVPFGWATLHAVNPDERVAVALAENLADRGLVGRIDKERTRFIAPRTDEARHIAQVAWISDLKPTTPPTVDLPMVEAETLDKLQARFRKDTETICKSLLSGNAPSDVTELLEEDAQAAFIKGIKPGCEKRYGS